jgi:uncharacterized membrane protein YhaH (DUF805 family)
VVTSFRYDRRTNKWIVLTCVLLVAIFTVGIAAIEAVMEWVNTPVTQTFPPYTKPVLPQVFFDYMPLLAGLLAAGIIVVRRWRKKPMEAGKGHLLQMHENNP